MSERAPYSRVYWQIRSDDRLRDVYPSDANLAAWLRLLLAADMAWPAPADLPRNVKASAVAALVEAGVIQQLPGGLFIFHGLDTERGRRKELATTRTGTGRGPDGTQVGPSRGPSLAEPSRAETETSLAEAVARDPADILWTLTGRYPIDKALSWIDDLTDEYGSEAVVRCLVEAHRADPSAKTLIGRTQDLLRHGARVLSVAAQKAERQRIEAHRQQPRVTDEAQRQAILRELLGDAA